MPPGDRQAERLAWRPSGRARLIHACAGHPRAARGAGLSIRPFTSRIWQIVTPRSASSRGRWRPEIKASKCSRKHAPSSKPWSRRYPEEDRYRQRLAEIINVLGFVYSKRLEQADALRCFEDVRKICESLLAETTSGAKPVKLLDLLSLSHYNIAAVHLQNRQYDIALESLKKSLAYRTNLAAAHPSVTRFQENLGETHEVIADIEHRAHQDDKALASFQTAIDILEKLVQAHPDVARYHRSLGRGLNGLGYLHDELRHNLEAIPAFERAIKQQELAIARSPDDNEYRMLLSNHLENLGEQYIDLGQVDRGLPLYRQAIEIRRQLCRAHPESQAYLLNLVEPLSAFGNVELHAGHPAEARQSFSEARKLLEAATAKAPSDSVLQIGLGASLIQEALALAGLHQLEQARPSLERALESPRGRSGGHSGRRSSASRVAKRGTLAARPNPPPAEKRSCGGPAR